MPLANLIGICMRLIRDVTAVGDPPSDLTFMPVATPLEGSQSQPSSFVAQRLKIRTLFSYSMLGRVASNSSSITTGIRTHAF